MTFSVSVCQGMIEPDHIELDSSSLMFNAEMQEAIVESSNVSSTFAKREAIMQRDVRGSGAQGLRGYAKRGINIASWSFRVGGALLGAFGVSRAKTRVCFTLS